MIGLTKAASKKVLELLSERSEMLGLRVAVRGGGCSGFQYVLEFEEAFKESDREISSHGVRLFIDPKSYLYLMGTEIDYVDTLSGAGFKFNNPTARRTCGCGESFSI